MQKTNSPQPDTLPFGMIDFIGALMRAINTARLYASGHDLFKKHILHLHTKLQESAEDRNFLFLGCAKNALFIEGAFYQSKDVTLDNFLKFAHSMGIALLVLYKNIEIEELESFVTLLAGARQGQGSEISSELAREGIKNARIGLLDYSIFATVQTMATQLAQDSQDESIWRQLILQPAALGTFKFDQEKIKQLRRLSENVEELKKIIVQMDADMTEKQENISITHRGLLLGNFIQNLGDTLAETAPEDRGQFARQVGSVLDSLDFNLKTQILGAISPETEDKKDSGITHEIIQTMPDDQLVQILVNALKNAGANSPCFTNLFDRALSKYKEAGLLLTIVRKEASLAQKQQKADTLSHFQHLEQLLLQAQETDDLNMQYHKEIEALATSIQIKAPMVEEDEMDRLLKTLAPMQMKKAKAELIIDLIGQPHTSETSGLIPSLLEVLGEILGLLYKQKDFLTVCTLLRKVYLSLADYPQDAMVRKTMNSFFSTEEIGELLENQLNQCQNYESGETAAINAICQLFPEKACSLLLDLFGDLEDKESKRGRWLMDTLESLGPRLSRILSRKLQGAPDHAIPRLLKLASTSNDTHLAIAVEQLLAHPTLEIRLEAVKTLGDLKAEQVAPRLIKILQERYLVRPKKVKGLQAASARALAEIATDEAKEALKKVAQHGPGDLKQLCKKLI